MPSDPNGWPDEAYEAVAKAIHIRRYMVPMFSDDARYCAALADAALTALAPFVAAREQAAYKAGWSDREDDLLAGHQRIGTLDAMLAQARREGMEEAARIADPSRWYPTDTAIDRARKGAREYVAAAIRAKAQEARDE